jgi:hypothetical protein
VRGWDQQVNIEQGGVQPLLIALFEGRRSETKIGQPNEVNPFCISADYLMPSLQQQGTDRSSSRPTNAGDQDSHLALLRIAGALLFKISGRWLNGLLPGLRLSILSIVGLLLVMDMARQSPKIHEFQIDNLIRAR